MSGHGHGHATAAASGSGGRRRLSVVLAITVTVLVVEVVGAVLSGSLALLADAAHVLTDVAGLLLALGAAVLMGRRPSPRRTWGWHRAEVVSAALQALVLLAVGAFVLVEAVRRLVHPPEVAGSAMALFGAVGLVGNLAAVAVLAGARTHDLNHRAAFLEVVNDALGSVAVLVAAAVVALTGWTRADPVASLVIGALIVPRTLVLLRESVEVLLESTPRGLDLDDVRQHLLEVAHVRDVHDLHAWQVATGLPVLTAHVVVDDACFVEGDQPAMLDEVQACLAGHFDVEHSTIQFEAAGHAAHEHARHD
ncbi:cation diffusion facilitator family transporter [Angustibacter aerolatus]|uniref:Cation transporter n=1 Tax=Angustibacter aerolatus TaxID=1162965 RepID=A0ABQ6JKV0_9ACTN|nr:cation diffusion facilitator family transporter [Angustibacter aerolatus]GMA88186.1 cation transporter [Angustibacter aerolatus]